MIVEDYTHTRTHTHTYKHTHTPWTKAIYITSHERPRCAWFKNLSAEAERFLKDKYSTDSMVLNGAE